MFTQLHINITLDDALILMPKYQKMLKALLSNKEKLQEVANTPLNENCSAVILKKLPKKLRDPGKFLIPCGFSELKCKALADLGASINLMPLSVWKKLGLPELIPTRMTLELANRAICTPTGIARDVFIPVGKFTFPANFVIVNYESDPRVPLILRRPFLRTARALIDVHGEEMILRDGDERLTLNMRHDTSSYSNQPQKESINLINVFNNSSEDFLEDLFPYQPSGNPTFSLHPELTLPKVNNDIFDLEGCNVLSEKLLDLDFTKDLHPLFHDNPLSGSTTYPLLEEFTDELPPEYDDNLQFDIKSDLKEIEFLLYQDKDSSLKDSINQKNRAHLADIFVDSIPEMFTDENTLDYSFPPIFDVYDDDFLKVESDAGNVYDNPFDSKEEKIKESKLLIDALDLPCDFLPHSEYDSFNSQDFFRVDALPSTNTEDKVFNPCILIQEKSVKIITRVVQDKKLAISNASLVLEDFDPAFYEPLFFKEIRANIHGITKQTPFIVYSQNQRDASTFNIRSIQPQKQEEFRIPLEEIKKAIQKFGQRIGSGGLGTVYKGQLSERWNNRTAAIKCLDLNSKQGKKSSITSLICLDTHIECPKKDRPITWAERLKICIGAARRLKYLHLGGEDNNTVIHRDVKSGNILLDEKFEAKICDFGLSKSGPNDQPHSKFYTKAAGTKYYIDPSYQESGILRKESDVYSFGVVMFELLTGIPAWHQRSFGEDLTLEKRPTMDRIINRIEDALELQENYLAVAAVRVIGSSTKVMINKDKEAQRGVVKHMIDMHNQNRICSSMCLMELDTTGPLIELMRCLCGRAQSVIKMNLVTFVVDNCWKTPWNGALVFPWDGRKNDADRSLAHGNDLGFTNPTLYMTSFIEDEPDIENMTLNEYLKYESKKKSQLWMSVRSKDSPTGYQYADIDTFH
nr:protein kinase, ATP binding site-containing protein [Tanacetum cinerariifolium]